MIAQPADTEGKPAASPEVATELDELRRSYQEASAEIERLGTVENDIGRGTLRREAAHTLGQLRSSGVGLTEEDLSPLSTYVATLSGGKTTELAVAALDKGAAKLAKDLLNSLLFLALKGSVAVIVGIVALAYGASSKAGESAATFILGGGGAAVVGLGLREASRIVNAAGDAVEGSWAWAVAIGSQAEAAMAGPRAIQERLWKRFTGGAPWRYTALATKASLWAMVLVAFYYAALAFALIAFGIGFVQAIEAQQDGVSQYGSALLPLGLG